MTPEEPILAPPGAGIPWYQRWLARHYFLPRGVKHLGWEGSVDRIQREHLKIETRLSGAAKPTLLRRILIPSLPGLEDSSRYWSVEMTLEHLMIVTEHGCEIVEALASGKTYNRILNKKDVKPTGNMEIGEALDAYRLHLPLIVKRLRNGTLDRKSTATYPHPWFGPLTAVEWVWVLAAHQALHRKQIQLILDLSE